MTSSLHPPWRGGLPREPPHGGRSLCREASNKRRPFASASGHHIASGKHAQSPYGGRPVNKLRVPRALLALLLPNGQEQEARALHAAVPALAGISPISLPTSLLPSVSPLRPHQLRREGQLHWDQQPSSPSPKGWGLRIWSMTQRGLKDKWSLEGRERSPPPNGTLAYSFTPSVLQYITVS